ncbi:hypothetical protein A2U01_0029904, partial [Trifolium medium]|nr:hypothetical protein [Trifolium medium]
ESNRRTPRARPKQDHHQSKRTPRHQNKTTTRAKEHPDTTQIRRKTKDRSPEKWEEGGAEGQAPLITPPPMALHLENWFWIRGIGWRLQP